MTGQQRSRARIAAAGGIEAYKAAAAAQTVNGVRHYPTPTPQYHLMSPELLAQQTGGKPAPPGAIITETLRPNREVPLASGAFSLLSRRDVGLNTIIGSPLGPAQFNPGGFGGFVPPGTGGIPTLPGVPLPPVVQTGLDLGGTINTLTGGGSCPEGTREEVGFGSGGGIFTQCIPVGGTDPVVGGPQVAGTAIAPSVASMPSSKTVRQCPKGPDGRRYVLGRDGLCYPKGMLKKDQRMNPKRPKPPITAADARAIRKADSARKRLVSLTKKSGAYASMSKPRSRSSSRSSRPVAAGRPITVIDTE